MAGQPPIAHAAAQAGRRYVLGAGRVYFALRGDDGTLIEGERYIGSTPGFSLSVTNEQTEVYDDDGPVAERVVQITRQVAHTFSVQCKNVTSENLALFIGGAAGPQADAATAVLDEPLKIHATGDRFYKLGIKLATDATHKPAGVGAIDADATVLVTPASGDASPYTVTTDYEVDAAAGRLYIPAGSAIVTAAAAESDKTKTVYVDYTPVAKTRGLVQFDEPQQVRGALRYIEDAANKGAPNNSFGYEFWAPLCTITPGGEFAVKSRENPQTITLSVAVQEPSSGPSFVLLEQGA